MIIVLMLITFAALFKCALEGSRHSNEYWENEELCFGIGCVLAGVLVIETMAIICLTSTVIESNLIDEKIVMYSEANNALEEDIKASAERFMEHEHGTYESLSPADAIAVATSYPELASSQIVQSQIQTYKENKNQITTLKEAKINAKVSRWWLYFGN